MTTHLPVNNYYSINDCNTIYMGFWKNENIVFLLKLSLLSIFSLLYLATKMMIFDQNWQKKKNHLSLLEENRVKEKKMRENEKRSIRVL